MDDGQLVYVVELDGTQAILFDIGSLRDFIESEFENITEIDVDDFVYKVYAKWMTGEELDALPEFNGF